MRNSKIILIFLILLTSCVNGGKKTPDIFLQTTQGIEIEYAEFKNAVYDGGKDPFDIVIKLENRGETDVNEVKLKLEGIKAQEFNKLEEEFDKKIKEEIKRIIKDKEGNVMIAQPEFITIKELNHITPIEGETLNFPVTAKICYSYETRAKTKICIKKDLLSEEGTCNIAEEKETMNTGAPVHVTGFKEMQRGKDAIGFSFKIKHKGTGMAYDKEENCAEKTKGKIHVKVSSELKGLTCTGLQTTDNKAAGYVTLLNGEKEVTCEQAIKKKKDYEKDVKIELEYKYEQTKTMPLTIRHFEGEK